MAGDDDEMLMRRSLSFTPKTTLQHYAVENLAYVTNNKRLRSTFCTTEANYRPTDIARPLRDSRATCSVCDARQLCPNGGFFRIYLNQLVGQAPGSTVKRSQRFRQFLAVTCVHSNIGLHSHAVLLF